jgi:hypothetical protein
LGVFARRTEERVRDARISLDRTARNWFYHWTFWIFSFLFGMSVLIFFFCFRKERLLLLDFGLLTMLGFLILREKVFANRRRT